MPFFVLPRCGTDLEFPARWRRWTLEFMGDPALLVQTGAVAQWTFLSVALILFNKWLMQYGGFPFPLTLVSMHMFFSSAVTFLLHMIGVIEPAVERRHMLWYVTPVGMLFAIALATGNEVFLYLSVAFIQMLKACTPAVVLFVSMCVGLEPPSCRLFLIIAITSGGVALTIYGELKFVWFGVAMMFLSMLAEALRLVTMELLFSKNGIKMSGLESVYCISPICFLTVSPVCAYFEGRRLVEALGSHALPSSLGAILGANCFCAFMLNVASMLMVKNTSALTMKVVGVAKDWIVIIVSSWLFDTAVSPMQWMGYSVAFVGILLYSHYKLVAAERARPLAPEEESLLKRNEHDGAIRSARSSLLSDGMLSDCSDVLPDVPPDILVEMPEGSREVGDDNATSEHSSPPLVAGALPDGHVARGGAAAPGADARAQAS